MKLDTFFEKFELFADAPGAVARMRELILWSAFSGVFSSKERNQPMPEEWIVEDAPILPAIPSSWNWQQGKDVFEVIRGVSYKKTDASDSPFDGSFPVLRANNIGNGINFDDLVYVPRSNIRDDQFVRRGDILIAMSSGSKKLVGKAAPMTTEFVGAFGAFCGVIRNKSEIPDMVLARYFQTPQYTSWVTAAGRGIGINNLGKGDLDSLPVPTPPLAEQKRIVAKVDELMALCDRLEAQQQERESRHTALVSASLARFADAPTPENLQFLFHPSYTVTPTDLRRTILSMAVQGKLVTQDHNDEPVSVLLERLVLLTAEGGKVPKPLRPIDSDALPFELPFSWKWVQAQDLCRPASLITYGVLKPVWVDIGVPTVRVQDIKDGIIVVDGIGQCSCERAEKFGKTKLESGDLLIAKDGATLGKTAFVPPSLAGGNITQHVLRFPMTPHVDKLFIRLVIDSPHGQAWMRSETKGVALPGVNVGDFRRMPIPLPPLAEQRRIVAKVDQLMALVDQLETQLAASQASAGKLMEAVVAELTSRT